MKKKNTKAKPFKFESVPAALLQELLDRWQREIDKTESYYNEQKAKGVGKDADVLFVSYMTMKDCHCKLQCLCFAENNRQLADYVREKYGDSAVTPGGCFYVGPGSPLTCPNPGKERTSGSIQAFVDRFLRKPHVKTPHRKKAK